MGILFSKPSPVKSLTEQERAHLVLLGTTAGNPDIVINAVKSGNIFDPKHMEEALARKAEWEQGIALLAPVIERQKRYEAEDEQLRKMGARVEERPDGMIVHGPTQLIGATVESHGDHRLAMALAVAGLAARGKTVVRGAEAINDSFPGFVETMQALGADIAWRAVNE